METGRRVSKARDAFWLLLAAVVLGWTVSSVVRSLQQGLYSDWGLLDVVLSAIMALAVYWVVMGAWRRTTWGQKRLRDKSGENSHDRSRDVPG